MPGVVCIGSLNVDLVFLVDRMPNAGETVTGGDLQRHLGGKGLNQALAVARAGAPSWIVGAVGTDDGGLWMRESLRAAGVDDSAVADIDGPSGTALIELDAEGANRIVVIPGANGWLNAEYTAEQVTRISGPTIALAPLEVPPAAVLGALTAAHAKGLLTVLNPAPVPPAGLPAGLLEVTDIVIPNEHEAALITGMPVADIASAADAGRWFIERGAARAVITLGSRGCVWVTPTEDGHIPAFSVRAIDTVAAGDAFCGALAASLAADMPWERSLLRASAAGALATTVSGASPSLPTAADIDALVSTR